MFFTGRSLRSGSVSGVEVADTPVRNAFPARIIRVQPVSATYRSSRAESEGRSCSAVTSPRITASNILSASFPPSRPIANWLACACSAWGGRRTRFSISRSGSRVGALVARREGNSSPACPWTNRMRGLYPVTRTWADLVLLPGLGSGWVGRAMAMSVWTPSRSSRG
jgi:hypothetical protein